MAQGERSSSPPSPSPRRSRRSPSLPRSRRSRSRSEEATNPGNNLYVTGLSPRVTESDLEKYFNREGKVVECHLVRDPHSKESRGFGFVTMETTKDAERCVKYLNRSVLEGRLITVEKIWLKGVEEELQLLEDIKVCEINKELVGTRGDLVVTHLGGDMTGIDKGDHHLLMAGGQILIFPVGDIGPVPSFRCVLASEMRFSIKTRYVVVY